MDEQIQKDVMEFNAMRQQLANVAGQKQQLQFQSDTLKAALDELKDSKEEKVYKAVGNILILKKATEVKKELTESKETVDLRLKTVAKQEETLLNKLNKMRTELEAAMGQGPETTTKTKK